MLCCPCQGQTHTKRHFKLILHSCFYYYFRGSRKSKEEKKGKQLWRHNYVFTLCLSLQICSWKVMNSVKIFYISQNLNVWHPVVKDVWVLRGFVSFGSLKLCWQHNNLKHSDVPEEMCSEPVSEWGVQIHRTCLTYTENWTQPIFNFILLFLN